MPIDGAEMHSEEPSTSVANLGLEFDTQTFRLICGLSKDLTREEPGMRPCHKKLLCGAASKLLLQQFHTSPLGLRRQRELTDGLGTGELSRAGVLEHINSRDEQKCSVWSLYLPASNILLI